MSEIRVELVYLSNLASASREIERALRSTSVLSGERPPSAVVASAYQAFCDGWDGRRQQLADQLADVAAKFEMTRDSFEQVDADLRTSIEGGSGHAGAVGSAP